MASTSQVSFIFLALLAFSAYSASASPTIYEILGQFGLPAGILPDSVSSFSTNGNSFVIYLKKPCYVKYDYLVSFDTEITGEISYGKITKLKGLKAQSLWFWLNVDEIKVNGDSLSFTLGLVTVNLDIAQFQTIPTCKDNALAACDHKSNLISQLPMTAQ